MDDPLWDMSETDPDEQRSLSEIEQQYLLTGDPGTYTISEMEDRVAVKTKKLPDRVQQLIDDISLLYFHGGLKDRQNELWEDILSISGRSQAVRRSPIVRTDNQQSDPELNLGFEVGSVIRLLHDEDVPAELIWGFTIGLVGESDRDWEREAENLVELFGELEDYYETRLVSAGTKAHEDDGFEEERKQIREVLRERGFAPAPPLIDTVLLEYSREDTAVQLESTEKPSSTDSNPAEHPEPPSENPPSEDVHRTSFESIVSRLASQTRLRSIDRLAKDVREDVIQIQNREIWGVDLDSLLCSLGENGKKPIGEFDEINARKHSKTHALGVLSYKDSTVVNRPVTREYAEAKWSLTPYGEILYITRMEYNCSTNWIYNVITDPERFDDDTISIISRLIEGGS